jgi:hypothetical protein
MHRYNQEESRYEQSPDPFTESGIKEAVGGMPDRRLGGRGVDIHDAAGGAG